MTSKVLTEPVHKYFVSMCFSVNFLFGGFVFCTGPSIYYIANTTYAIDLTLIESKFSPFSNKTLYFVICRTCTEQEWMRQCGRVVRPECLLVIVCMTNGIYVMDYLVNPKNHSRDIGPC